LSCDTAQPRLAP